MAKVASHYGVKRQHYYQQCARAKVLAARESRVVELVQAERRMLSQTGGKKLYAKLYKELSALKVGRDKFFEILGKHGYLIKPTRRYVATTDSGHGRRTYPNRAKDLSLHRANQLWVSDITYLSTLEGFCYLALITDAYSRKIVGYDVSDSLEKVGCIRALKQAKRQLPAQTQVMHHSDRGSQYCSHAYIRSLKQAKIQISMTEENHCYENALAERVNGILKQEFGLYQVFPSKKHLYQAIPKIIQLYNQYRLHWSLGLQTPEQVHQGRFEIELPPSIKKNKTRKHKP